jgi:hypothetical protein
MKLGAPLWLSIIIVAWGICATLFCTIKSVTGFYVLRFLLGEARSAGLLIPRRGAGAAPRAPRGRPPPWLSSPSAARPAQAPPRRAPSPACGTT